MAEHSTPPQPGSSRGSWSNGGVEQQPLVSTPASLQQALGPPPWRTGEGGGPLADTLRLARPSAPNSIDDRRRREAAASSSRSSALDQLAHPAVTPRTTTTTSQRRLSAPATSLASYHASSGIVLGSGKPHDVKPFPPPSYLQHSVYYHRFFTFPPSSYDTKHDDKLDQSPYSSFVNLPVKDPKGVDHGPGHSMLGLGSCGDFGDRGGLIGLPTHWDKDDRCPLLEVDKTGMELRFQGTGIGGDRDAAAARANRAMPPQCGIYYFEIEIMSKGESGYIGIGFCTLRVLLSRLPGWEEQSWGYHGDDGHVFSCQGTGKKFGPKFSKISGDVVGCGIDWTLGKAFFTKNGTMLGYVFENIVGGGLYPAVGLKSPGERIRANFGCSPFRFDIDSFVRAKRQTMLKELSTTDICQWTSIPDRHETPPRPKEYDCGATESISEMVLEYLDHHGYAKTASSFLLERERIENESKRLLIVKQTSSQQKQQVVVTTTAAGGGEEVIVERQQIRQAILKGNLELAIKLIQLTYPKIFEEAIFDLRLQQFVELVCRPPPALRTNNDTSQLKSAQDLYSEFSTDQRPHIQHKLRLASTLLSYDNPNEARGEVGVLASISSRITLSDRINSLIIGHSTSSLESVVAHQRHIFNVLGRDGVTAFIGAL